MPSTTADRTVVITGLGVVTPLGHQVDLFWSNLLAGKCGIDRITSFDPAGFDTQIAAEGKDFDPALDLEKVNRDEVGVFLGSGIGGLKTTSEQLKVLLERGPGRLSPFMIPM